MKISLVKNCYLFQRLLKVFPACQPHYSCSGEIWAFLHPPSNKFPQFLSGRRHLSPHVRAFRTAIELHLYYFIILF